MQGFAQLVVNGLLLGGIYAAMAFGLALTLGIMRVINVAHSTFIILGAYLGFEMWRRTGLHPLLVAPAIAVVVGALGMLVARYVVEPLKNAHETVTLVALFGVMIILETAVTLVWTADTRRVQTSLSGRSLDIGVATLPLSRTLAAASCVAVLLVLHVFMTRHPVGKALRAMAENRDMAALLGVDTRRLSVLVFSAGVGLAAFSGAALSTVFPFTPQVHFTWLAWAFLVVVIGGLGSVTSTLLAGLAVGLVETFLATVVDFQFVYLVMYGVLGLALLFKTEGLSSVASRRV